MRDAGVPVEMIARYVKLYKQGNSTFNERKELLEEAKIKIVESLEKYNKTLDKINFKIKCYEDAVKTGILTWDKKEN